VAENLEVRIKLPDCEDHHNQSTHARLQPTKHVCGFFSKKLKELWPRLATSLSTAILMTGHRKLPPLHARMTNPNCKIVTLIILRISVHSFQYSAHAPAANLFSLSKMSIRLRACYLLCTDEPIPTQARDCPPEFLCTRFKIQLLQLWPCLVISLSTTRVLSDS
jgi:hypothetical protein